MGKNTDGFFRERANEDQYEHSRFGKGNKRSSRNTDGFFRDRNNTQSTSVIQRASLKGRTVICNESLQEEQ